MKKRIKTFEDFKINEGKTTDGLSKDAMKLFYDLEGKVGFCRTCTITNYNMIDPAIKDHKLYKKISPRDMRILGDALGNVMRFAIEMER
mgnify:FL=1